MLTPTFQSIAGAIIGSNLKAQRSLIFEGRHRAKDGRIFPVEVNANYFEYGGRAYNLALVRDITERKRAEEALRESEQKFRSFVEESSEGFTLVDEQGAIIEWNHAREKITGLPASQVIGQKLWDVLHQMLRPELQTPERYERNKQPILNALQTGKSPLFDNVLEAEVVRQNGERQFIQQTIFPIKTDKGYRMGSVTRDITERKRAEEALRRSAEEIYDLYNHAPCGYHSLNNDGVFIQINDTELQWLGYSRDEVIGKMKFAAFITGKGLQTFEEQLPAIQRTRVGERSGI